MKTKVLITAAAVAFFGTIAPALSATVTYYFDNPSNFSPYFTGSFSFDTTSGMISNAVLQSVGIEDVWTRQDPSTYSNPFLGIQSGDLASTDLVFASPSFQNPSSAAQDTVFFQFFDSSFSNLASLNGVDTGFIYGLAEGPLPPPNSIYDYIVEQTLTLTPPAATPLPPTWTLMLIGLAGFGVVARWRTGAIRLAAV